MENITENAKLLRESILDMQPTKIIVLNRIDYVIVTFHGLEHAAISTSKARENLYRLN